MAEERKSIIGGVRWLLLHLDDVAATLALFGVLFIVAQEMVARSAFGVSFTWTEDLSRVLLIAGVYFGASAVAWENRHIRVEFVLDALPAGLRRAVQFVIDLACLGFALTAVWLGVRLVKGTAALGLSFAHSDLALPVWIAQASIPVAFAMMSVRLAIRLAGYRPGAAAASHLQREG